MEEKKIAKAEYSIKRIVRKLLLVIQSSSFLPSIFRVKLLKIGGVEIGDSFVGDNVEFDSIHPELISIGNKTFVTSGCKIISHYFSPEDSTFYLGQVKIGNNVFLGMNTLIISPVTIGDNAVLAAGSVVTRDIPIGEIWGGVPAKFIKKRIIKQNN